MTISQLIETAFQQSASLYEDIHRSLIDASHSIGSLLPSSLLIVSIQKAGELDMVIRCMEDENVAKRTQIKIEIDFSFHYQLMLSELWIGQVYEFIRLLTERKLETKPEQFLELAHQLRLLRIPIEKYEIAADRKLTSPIKMQKYPPNNDETDYYTYSKDDPYRAHIMPTSISERGSVMWNVIDINSQSTYWIERRKLSEQLLLAFE